MKKGILLFLVLLLGTLSLSVPQAFSVPALINYQGRVTNTDGSTFSGNYAMKFKIYTVKYSGGTVDLTTLKWEEEQLQVGVNNGIFNVLLGSGTAYKKDGTVLPEAGKADAFKAVFNGGKLYLEVQVSSGAVAIGTLSSAVVWDEPMTPRQEIASVGYAMTAGKLDASESMKLIHEKVFDADSGAGYTISGLAQAGYTSYKLEIVDSNRGSGYYRWLRFNGDTSSNYTTMRLFSGSNAWSAPGLEGDSVPIGNGIGIDVSTATGMAFISVSIFAAPNVMTGVTGQATHLVAPGAHFRIGTFGGTWSGTAKIDEMNLTPGFKPGSIVRLWAK